MKTRNRLSMILLMVIFVAACSNASTPPPENATSLPTTTKPASFGERVGKHDDTSAQPTATAAQPTATPDVPLPTATPLPPPTNTPTPVPIVTGQPIENIAEIDTKVPESVQKATQPDNTMYLNYSFAPFQVQTKPAEGNVANYIIEPDLANVTLPVLLSPAQRVLLEHNGFVVSPNTTKEFYELYERARYQYIPSFVTSDSLLHVYHLLFDKTLRRTESEYLVPMIARLDWELLHTSAMQYEALNGTAWGEAARRNAAYFAVAVKLLNPLWNTPNGLHDLTDPDLEQITAHAGIADSAIFPNYPEGEDWSQYVPRGHYTKSETLQRYFQVMMWHGRMTFRANDTVETQQAALLTQALRTTKVDGKPAYTLWKGIYEPTIFFVGRSDDLTPMEYAEALDKSYGSLDVPNDLLNDAAFADFQQQLQTLPAPQVLGMVINRDEPDVDNTTRGLRFMGQRLVPDAFVFRQLVHRNVPDRMLPKGLDLFAVLQSERARTHLTASGDTAMPRYTEQMKLLQELFTSYDETTWTQNLYWTWLYSLRPLLTPTNKGYPGFMQSDAWRDKQLNTVLASWTELKHDTILYAKQVYVEKGAGGLPPPAPEQPKGYVEPVPLFYARIAALVAMTTDGLEKRGLLYEDDRHALERLHQLAQELETIANKELRSEPLTDEEYELIRFYGAEIESLTFAADDESVYYGRGGTPAGGDALQAAVVSDVATNPNGTVLEEGVGRVFDVYVVVPIEGTLTVAQGGVFSHYEFTQPLGERLTDEAWRTILDQDTTPPLATWYDSFVVEERVEQPLADTIIAFNDQLVEAFWYTVPEFVAEYLGEEEMADTRTYIEQELIARGMFLGMTRHAIQFRSFDFQDATHATVATLERWSDELYRGSPDMDYNGDIHTEKIATRPPFDMSVTYTMEQHEDHWIITAIVTDADEPEWQPVASE